MNRIIGIISITILLYQGGQILRVKFAKVERRYDPVALEFKTSAPMRALGSTWLAVHTFKLSDPQTISGMSFRYRVVKGLKDQGEDVILYYLAPEQEAFYRSNYLDVGKECPASFIHKNLKAHVLIGANESITKKLVSHHYNFNHTGTPFIYEGHVMTYQSSLADQKPAHVPPAEFEIGISNVGTVRTPYDYFLVTGFPTSVNDTAMRTPAQEAPANLSPKDSANVQ